MLTDQLETDQKPMLSEKETTRRSKLLSLELRHEPAHLGISLDE